MGKKQLFRILRLGVFWASKYAYQELEYSIYKHIIDKAYSSEPNCNRSVLDWKRNITILKLAKIYIFASSEKKKFDYFI